MKVEGTYKEVETMKVEGTYKEVETMKVEGTYKEVRTNLPEEVRFVLDKIVPQDAEVHLTAVRADDSVEVKDSCSGMPCESQCKECPVDAAVSISDYVDCMDVELEGLYRAIDYVGVPVDKKKVLAGLKQISDAATRAIEILEGGM